MDRWKFFDITHREHILCNPMSMQKFGRLLSLLRLQPGASVLEIATGKGEFIIQLAERYDISGVGVDISPFCIADAQAKLQERALESDITFLEMGGADYKPDKPESFDLGACIGASWIFSGHKGTLEALIDMVKPGGFIVVGEPHWIKDPDQAYLEASNLTRDAYGFHHENVLTGEALGLTLQYALVSNHDDWDNYEGLGWYAAENYALEHPDDPDIAELLARVNESKHEYLRWGRDTLGWAIYVFRKPSQN